MNVNLYQGMSNRGVLENCDRIRGNPKWLEYKENEQSFIVL